MITRSIGGRHGVCVMALMAGCLTAGCTSPQDTGPVAPAAGTQFDGIYTGQSTVLNGWGFVCGAPSYPEAITVSGGRFDFPFEVDPPRTAPIPVQIAADGTFNRQTQYGVQDYTPRGRFRTEWVTVTGRIAGGVLDATVADARCVRRLTAQRG